MLYLFQVHLSESSECADHCIKHSLSDANESSFKSDCDHAHDERCEPCDELKQATQSVENKVINSPTLTNDDKDELMYLVKQACEAINAWKSHQLRSMQQDKARLDILEMLDETSVFLTNDWAMKYLPQKYRKTQADWFAKRGISWHISVVVRKVKGSIEHQTLVHIVKNTTQDSTTVIGLLKHTLMQLKKEHPEIITAFLRQDNAGCYHSVALLTSCRHLSETGINIERVDFSDPQGGKGPCDRKAATIKSHVRRFLNEGNDVTTAEQLYNAMTSHGGINGVRVVLVDNVNMKVTMPECNLKGVNSFNNFFYKQENNLSKCLVVWKAYNIGDGKEVPWTNVESKLFRELFTHALRIGNTIFYIGKGVSFSCLVEDIEFSCGNFVPVATNKKNVGASKSAEIDSPAVVEDPTKQSLYSCPNEGCVKSFQRHGNLQNHISYGKCLYKDEKVCKFRYTRTTSGYT